MRFRSFDAGVVAVTSWIVVYLTAQMTVVVLLGVFWRYVLSDALAWVEELARYTMIWLSWIGGGLAVRKGAHIAVEFIVDALPPNARAAIIAIGRVLALFFLSVCIWYGIDLMSRVSMQSTIALGISMQIPYAAAPVGAALMVYHTLVVTFCPWARPVKSHLDYQP